MWKHVLFVLLTTQSVSAAVLNVTSNAPSQPGVTSCLLAAPCSLDDALRIAESNGENNMITLQEPSGFQPNGRTYRYLPLPSDLNTDITIMRFAGSGVFEGAGYFLSLDIDSQSGNVTLDGITLRNSVATYTKDPALRIDTDGNITLRNCNIRDIQRDPIAGYQRASGALLRSARLVTIEDCTFSRIVPDALEVRADRAEIRRSYFLDNGSDVGRADAAAELDVHSALVQVTQFELNESSADPRAGGGLSIVNNLAGLPLISPANTQIIGNRFISNTAFGSGGGLFIDRGVHYVAVVEVEGNEFRDNRAKMDGGGLAIAVTNETRTIVRNNLFVQNAITTFGQGSGSAIDFNSAGEAHLLNNTIDGSIATGACNAAAVDLDNRVFNASFQVHNNIIRDSVELNCGGVADDLVVRGDEFAPTVLRNNAIGERSFFPNQPAGNVQEFDWITALPDFVDEAHGDYHLASFSALVDAGSNSSSYLGSVDMDQQSRIQNAVIDVGADEFAGVARRLVQVIKNGTGQGSVSSIPSGIICPVACPQATGEFDLGSTIGLVALPDANSEFLGWGMDCAGSTLGTTLNVSSNRVCTAQFGARAHDIVVYASGLGTGAIASSHPNFGTWFYPLGGNARTLSDVVPGSSVSFTIETINPLTEHVLWTDCEVAGGVATGQYSSLATCTFSNVASDLHVHGEIKPGTVLFPTRTLTVSKQGIGSGLVQTQPGGISCGGQCSSTFFINTEVVMTAQADPGSVFAGWSGDCAASGSAPSANVLMADHRNCVATFAGALLDDVFADSFE